MSENYANFCPGWSCVDQIFIKGFTAEIYAWLNHSQDLGFPELEKWEVESKMLRNKTTKFRGRRQTAIIPQISNQEVTKIVPVG